MLTYRLARRYGLRSPLQGAIAAQYAEEEPMPIQTNSPAGTLWADPYYLAYQLKGEGVRYLYISKTHILEEVRACREASAHRGKDIRLPEDVRRAFAVAAAYMKSTGEGVWVGKLYPEDGSQSSEKHQ